MITEEQINRILPNCKDPVGWAAILSANLPKFGIDCPERIAGFVSQCGHESAYFNVLEENLNYSASGLLRVFPKYFPTQEEATRYANRPEMIANRVYGNRMGNGDESTGDGYRYRGRGLIQLTGKNNYVAASKDIYGDNVLLGYPEMVSEPETAVLTACWFWDRRNLNEDADDHDVETMTKKINGGLNGIQHRTELFERAMDVLLNG